MGNVGKWTYNKPNEENWYAEEEFDTKDEAIAAGKKYFTEPDGYLDYEGEPFEGEIFDVGLISDPYIKVNARQVIDSVTEDVYEESGEYADGWLNEVNKENKELLSVMLTETFKHWLVLTNNKPKFYTIKNIHKVNLDENEIE